MRELKEDSFYKLLSEKYDELLLDYALLSFDEEYRGTVSHKKAVMKAISVFNTRVRVGNSLKHPQFYVDEDKMYCEDYSIEDFSKLNHLLFPVQFRKDLEIYSWNDNFSNYFDDGKEWWETAMWSIYDKWMKRFVIIGASLTD